MVKKKLYVKGHDLDSNSGQKASFHQYKPLEPTRKKKILEEALSADLIPTHRRTLVPLNENVNKHCLYPHNLGHMSNECTLMMWSLGFSRLTNMWLC